MSAKEEVQRTTHGEWGGFATLALVGAGIALGSPLLIASAAIPLAFVVAAEFGTEPPDRVELDRRFVNTELLADGAGAVTAADAEGTTPPDSDLDDEKTGEVWFGSPGDTVSVETTVQNTSQRAIADVRIVDGVPDGLPVVSGSPRTGASLHPGEAVTVSYDIELRRGEFEFEAPTVRTRDMTATTMRTWQADVSGTREIRCSPGVDSVTLGETTNDYAGTVPTDEGGNGVEFHSIRDYEPGDPVRSIDWRRYANTRDLATVEFRAERSTRIVCVVDARLNQFRKAAGAYPRAITLSTDGVRRLFDSLTDAGFPTGVVGLHTKQLTAVPPGTSSATRRHVSDLIDAFEASNEQSFISTWVSDGTYTRTRTGDPVEQLPGLLPGGAQVFLFSSFVDEEPISMVERLRTYGYDVQVISPDVTMGEDTATRLEAVARANRLASARAVGATVHDWKLDRSLGLVLADAINEVGTQ